MIKAFVSDFSRVLLSPKDDNYTEGLNALHKKLSAGGDYNFWSHFRLNQDLIAFYKTIGEHMNIYMFTTEYIQEHTALEPELAGVFKKVFSGARLGLKKDSPNTYRVIAEKIGLKPDEVLYIDDKQENLNAAKEAGMVVLHYESNAQAMKDITDTLKNPALFWVSLKLILKNKKGEILGLNGHPRGSFAGYYDLPGGTIEPNEFRTPHEDILRRELGEEVGIINVDINSTPIGIGRHIVPSAMTSKKEGDVFVFYVFFEGTYLGGKISISTEHSGFSWLDLKKNDPEKLFKSGMLEGIMTYLKR